MRHRALDVDQELDALPLEQDRVLTSRLRLDVGGYRSDQQVTAQLIGSASSAAGMVLRPEFEHGRTPPPATRDPRFGSVLLEPGQVNDVRTLECIVALDKEGGPPGARLRIGQRVHVTILNRPAPARVTLVPSISK